MNNSFLLDAHQALGTKWYIEIFQELSNSQEVEQELLGIITSFENKYSRFKKESLLSQLNTNRRILYDKEFAAILVASQDFHEKSGGLFDIFIKDVLVAKGYGVGKNEHPVDADESTFVFIENEIILTGTKSIDFGGIGKGYLIDVLKNYLQSKGVEQFVINGGGDMYVTHNNGEPIEIVMQHPTNKDEAVGTLLLKDKAFCCSSSYVRMWEKDGEKKNHFVTQDKKEVWAASYVVGETATSADVAATVLCIASDDEEVMKTVAHKFDVTYLVYDKDFNSHGNLVFTNLASN